MPPLTPTGASNVSRTRRREHRASVVARYATAIAPLLALSLACGAASLRAQAAPTGSTSALTVSHTVDHSAYDALLHRFVVDGHVDYEGFGRDPSFAHYLASLDAVKPATLDDAERLAFWLNVYNAFTIQLIAQHGETQSIRNIEKTFGVLRLKGPWSTPIVRAAGQQLTLDDVEHHILRTEFSDPRIHFAMVYGAMGSPPLRSEAYRGVALDAQLQDQGRRFLRESPSQNRLEAMDRARILVLSPVFTYYRADFPATRAEFGKFLAQWFEPADRERLQRGAFMSTESSFDWTLNSQRKAVELAARLSPDTGAARKARARDQTVR